MKSKLTPIALLAAFASVAQAQFHPVPLTPGSFTYAVVVPSNAPNILPQCITATSGAGTGEGDNTYFEQGYYAKAGLTGHNYGVPPHNTVFTNNNNTNCRFLMPPTYLTNNDLQIDSTHSTGSFTVTTPTNAIGLAILEGGGGSNITSYTVNHASGTPETGNLNINDWFTAGNTQVAWGCNARVSAANAFDVRSTSSANTTYPYLYSYYVSLVNTDVVTSVTFTSVNAMGHEANFYGLSATTDGTNYFPVPVGGFNQKTTVPAFNYPGYPLTATMDNGTNINAGANTWFEKGYDTAAPTDGLPSSGSSFTSSTQPTHTYQMGNYSTNSGVLIDVNHKSNNIVPLNPQPYTAFAFLTAGGNVGTGNKMTNICILQHLGGVNETNVFIGYDWFESTVPNSVAFTANGRVSMNGTSLSPNGCSFNNIGAGNPKLFETFFSLSDTVDAVTNIIVLYGTAPGANSTTFIMAVSATAGGLAPLPSAISPASQSWYTGQTATFSVTVAGTAPITNSWAFDSGGGYVPLTDGPQADGSIVSGSSTTSLVISNLQIADAGNYEYLAANSIGQQTAGPATLAVSDAANATAVTIVSQSPPASSPTLVVFTNQAAVVAVTVNSTASPPISYQWYNGSTPIAGATSALYRFTNLDSAALSCTVSNIGGQVSSTPVTISDTKTKLASPAAYQAALLAYNPVSYWPLDETSGSVAYDLVGNNDGTYIGNCILGEDGIPNFLGFGTNYSVSFDGSTAYVDIPVNNLNITGPITVIEWVETTGEVNNTDFEDDYFSTPLGHGDPSYRLDVDGSGDVHFADASPDLISTINVADGNWHQLVGVYDGSVEYLYVDGKFQESTTASTPTGSTEDVWIGGEPSYGTQATEPDLDRLFYGNIAQVAILTNALTSNQVAALYASLSIPATVSAITHPATGVSGDTAATPTIYAGANLTLTATVSGTPTPALQWYYVDNSSVSNIIAGATNTAFTISNAAASLNGYYYGMLVTNDVATNTLEVQLTVEASSPSYPPGGDISPLAGEAYVGAPIIYTVQAGGALPIAYQWSLDGTNIAGATNSTFTLTALCGTHSIQAAASNSFSGNSPTLSSVATLQGDAYPTNITFTNGAAWQLNGSVQSLNDGALELTDGSGSEKSSAFYPIAQYVGSFTASFTYIASGTRQADGVAFVIENSTNGDTALGAAGGSLGYAGITDSAALELNLYQGDGIAAATNGLIAAAAPTGGISLTSGDPINFTLFWNNGTLSVSMLDTVSLATYSTSYTLGSLTPVLGGTDLGYVGFTGADGGLTSIQTITNFVFTEIIPAESLTLTKLTAGSFQLSWPSIDPNFVLEQSADLLHWLPGPSPTVVGGVNQVSIIANGGTQTFYRLARVVCE